MDLVAQKLFVDYRDWGCTLGSSSCPIVVTLLSLI